MECKGCCIHNSMCGCMMLDCIRHPDIDKYSTEMNTNTFVDRFMDRNREADYDKGHKTSQVGQS